MNVDRCVCHNTTFAAMRPFILELRAQGHDDDAIFEWLRANTRCSTGCGLCEPYVKRCIRTGRIRFSPIPPSTATLQ
jgi:hypothetical protein